MAGTGGGGTAAIGIDLGTTYSCVGVYRQGKVEIIVNAQGNRTTPSCVAFTDEDCLVGDAARNQAVRNPSNTIFDAKRLIGRKFSDPIVQNDIKLWPFKIEAGPDDKPMISVQYKGEAKRLSAEDVSAMVLKEMREIAEAYLGNPVSKAVVTVPAYFNNSQRQATRKAGVKAGLDIIRVINEPTAAAIAYGLEENAAAAAGKKNKKNVLIFDLGGGTFDVSLAAIDVGGALKVLATAGDSHLGGVDFDGRLVDHCVAEFRRRHGKDMSGDPKALRRLRNACEKAKCTLSFTVETTIELDYLYDGEDFVSTISAAKFEQLNVDLFDKCMDLVESCLRDANTQKSDVHEVILVGGSTRIPKIQELLQRSFQGSKICKGINPDEAVACGAAIHAAVLAGEESMRMTFQDVAAAVFEDVTPLSLGVGIAGGLMSVLIPKNTPIPTRREKLFTTSFPNQTTIRFTVYEGERTVAKENDRIGEFELSGVPPAPKLVPKVPVTFEINADGILVVSAEHADTHGLGKATITISAKDSGGSGWSGKKEANSAQQDDNRNLHELIRRTVECRLRLESYAHDLRNMIRGEMTGRKVTSSDRKTMEDGIDKVLRWLQDNDSAGMEEFDQKRSELELLWTTIICTNNDGTVRGQNEIISRKLWFCCC